MSIGMSLTFAAWTWYTVISVASERPQTYSKLTLQASFQPFYRAETPQRHPKRLSIGCPSGKAGVHLSSKQARRGSQRLAGVCEGKQEEAPHGALDDPMVSSVRSPLSQVDLWEPQVATDAHGAGDSVYVMFIRLTYYNMI